MLKKILIVIVLFLIPVKIYASESFDSQFMDYIYFDEKINVLNVDKITTHESFAAIEILNNNEGEISCDDIFKTNGAYNDTWKLLNSLIKFIQYSAVILAIVLSVIDLIKLVPSNDKNAFNKSLRRAGTRLIIAILIFFLPIILDFILELMGFNNPSCGLL